MIDFTALVTPASVAAGVGAGGRKQLLSQLAGLVARGHGLEAGVVLERLTAREKLGSTGFGGGIAIPHAKLDGLARVVGGFARTASPVEFGAVDALPVDLAFVLISPADAGADHLKALAWVSRQLRDAALVAKLRGAGSSDALYALLAGVEARDAA